MLKMQVIGYIGQDARIVSTSAGSGASFSVAHSYKQKDSNGVPVDRAVWVDCSVWDRDALYPYLKKGTLVFVEGLPVPKQYQDREGKTVAHLALTVLNLQLLGGQREHTSAQTSVETNTATSTVTDDLPF